MYNCMYNCIFKLWVYGHIRWASGDKFDMWEGGRVAINLTCGRVGEWL